MQYEVTHKHIGTVKDIRDREDLTLATDSKEVCAIADHLGIDPDEFGAYFVKVEDGDYTEVYAIEGTVPYFHSALYQIEQVWQ